MQKYIDEHEGIRARTSLSVYKSVKKHLQDYSKANGKKVTFDSIDFNFFQSFQNYLYKDKTDSNGKVIKGLNNTTAAKQLSTIKTFLNYAKQQGVAVTDSTRILK
jgi:site-specific recombinase XerD